MVKEKGYTQAEATVTNIYGIHARPSALICNQIKSYKKDVYLRCLKNASDPDFDSKKRINCHSVFAIIMMNAGQGSIIEINVEGEDEEAKEICKELETLVSSNFEEIVEKAEKEKDNIEAILGRKNP